MSFAEVTLAVILAGWWLLSLVAQWPRGPVKELRHKDILHLIPSWRFFAPVPARRDYHLEYRVRHDGATRPDIWTRVPLNPPRDWRCVFLNPRKRTRKAFNTAVRRITKLQSSHGYDTAARSLPYLQLLYFLHSRYAGHGAVALQFRIVACQDFATDRRSLLVFKSSWHLHETCK